MFCPETGLKIVEQPQPIAYAPQAMAPVPAAQGGVRHAYPLAIRDASFGTAVGLMMKTLPYALARFAVLFAVAIVTVVWYVVAFGGFARLGGKIHPFVGFAWLLASFGIYGWLWWLVVRYFLYLLKCGHIAVLTELITQGRIDNGSQGMFAYGKKVVESRFAEVNVLFVIDRLVSGVVRAFNRTLDFIAGLLPVPGLSSIMSFVNAVIYAATTYLDETIFSYGLARRETNPWASAKDGLIYYAQNSKEILKTGVYVVILEKVLTVVVWIVMLAPAFALSAIMPRSVVGWGAIFVFGFAALLAGTVRAAFLKPLFLIMVMTKFHVQIQNQPIHLEWDERLSRVSSKFREIEQNMRGYRPAPMPAAVQAA
ncbi:MAG TPA: hypothetical protein VGL13_13995 [Polyangiaceae bacterium]